MTEEFEQFSTVQCGTCTQIAVRGELDMGCVPAFRRTLDAALLTTTDTLLVDLEAVAFLDSSALALLLETERRAGGANVRLVVIKPAGHARRVLDLCKLDGRITFVDTSEDHRPAAA
jgi:anti-anti-sigma factor